jgi:hypothetical protein
VTRFRALFVALLIMAGLVAVPAAQANATVAANSICNAADGSYGKWGYQNGKTYQYVYKLYPGKIAAPAWCINANGGRLVAQQNGALLLINREHQGGTVMWKSTGYNKGADSFRFQSDGNIVFMKGTTVLWAASWSSSVILNYGKNCFNPTYITRVFSNRWEWWGYGTGFVCTVNGDSDGTSVYWS